MLLQKRGFQESSLPLPKLQSTGPQHKLPNTGCTIPLAQQAIRPMSYRLGNAIRQHLLQQENVELQVFHPRSMLRSSREQIDGGLKLSIMSTKRSHQR
jgi:hypothetical protein